MAANPDYGTHTYVSLGQTGSGAPAIQRSKLSQAVGLTPSKIDIEIFATPSIKLANQPILSTIMQGLWTNARVWVRRAWLLPSDKPLNWNTPWPSNLGGAGDGTIIWFGGNIGKVTELGPLNAKFEARDLLWLLNRPFPKNLFGPQCYHKLFDEGCGLDKAVFTFYDTVQSGSTAQVINTTQTQDQGQPTSGPAAGLTLGYSNFGHSFTLPATTYFVTATYTTQYGETMPGPTVSIAVPPNNVMTAAHPPSVTGATGYIIYIGTAAGDLQQQEQFVGFTQNYQESADGIYLSGTFPPTQPTDGYFSLGTLVVTYATGALAGQAVSASVETSAWNGTYGVLTLRVPLPQVPAVSDALQLVPGCGKSLAVCGSSKFSNLIRYSGTPFTPTPEAGA